MDSTDFRRFERKAKRRYEAARLMRSLLGFAPVLLVVVAAALLGRKPLSALGFGSLLYVSGVMLLWQGRGLHRAVIPGVIFGSIPLVLALAANLGHGCTGDHCSSLCLPACAVGGLTSGFGMSVLAIRKKFATGVWVGAALTTFLTGAMGCSCIGYSGVMGLGLGLAVGSIPLLGRRLLPAQ